MYPGERYLKDIAPKRFKTLVASGANKPVQTPARNDVFFFDYRAQRFRIEQAEGALEDRADLVPGLQHIDGMDLHQGLDSLGKRRLAAANRSQQVQYLLALLQTLGGVPKEANDALDRVFHAVEPREGGIGAYRPVQKNTAKAGVLGRINHLRLTDRC